MQCAVFGIRERAALSSDAARRGTACGRGRRNVRLVGANIANISGRRFFADKAQLMLIAGRSEHTRPHCNNVPLHGG